MWYIYAYPICIQKTVQQLSEYMSLNSTKFYLFFLIDCVDQWRSTFLLPRAKKRFVIFVAGRTHNSSKVTHNIHPY